MGIPISALIKIKKGGNNKKEQGTWVHPEIAINIAQWCSSIFAVKVSRIVLRYYSGDTTLFKEIKQNKNIINGLLNEDCFYKDELISTYDDKQVFYVGNIGIIDDEDIDKIGISTDVYRREFKEHQKNFKKAKLNFNMLLIILCDNLKVIEEQFIMIMTTRGLYREREINGKTVKELVASGISDIKKRKEYYREIILQLIKDYPLKSIKERDDKIKLLEDNNELKIKELDFKMSDNYKLELENKKLELENKKLELELKKLELEKLTLQLE